MPARIDDLTSPLYTTRQAAELAGVTFRMLDYWCRTGVIRPTVEADGSGSRRRFSVEEVSALRIIRQLRDVGLDLETAADIVRGVLELPASVRPSAVLVDSGGRVVGPDDEHPPVLIRIDLGALAQPTMTKVPASSTVAVAPIFG